MLGQGGVITGAVRVLDGKISGARPAVAKRLVGTAAVPLPCDLRREQRQCRWPVGPQDRSSLREGSQRTRSGLPAHRKVDIGFTWGFFGVAEQDDPCGSRQDGFRSDEDKQQEEAAVFHGWVVIFAYSIIPQSAKQPKANRDGCADPQQPKSAMCQRHRQIMLIGGCADGNDQCNHSQNDKDHRDEHDQDRIFRRRRLSRRNWKAHSLFSRPGRWQLTQTGRSASSWRRSIRSS